MTDEILEEIKTEALKEFEQIATIYRPSFETRAIADYLKQRIKELRPDIEVFEDEYRANLVDPSYDPAKSSGNIWFDIPANSERDKDNEPIILQAHMDMVVSCIDNNALEEMKKNGVMLEYHMNGTLTSLNNQTTLGADDGISIGFMLAIMKNNNFKHGPIRCIITVEEETGMCGASYLGLTKDGKKGGPVQGFKYLINIDNLTDGEIVVSTLGAVILEYAYPKLENTEPLKSDTSIFHVDIDGLIGGHDGLNIEGHVSAAYIISEILKSFIREPSFRLIEFLTPDSGFHSVIQKHAHCTFALNKPINEINDVVENVINACKNQFPLETGITSSVEPQNLTGIEIRPFSHEMSVSFVKFLNSLPFGIISWKDKESGWLESSGNFGPVYLTYEEVSEDGKIIWKNPSFKMKSHFRCCDNDKLNKSYDERQELVKQCFGPEASKITIKKSQYFGWAGNSDQTLVDVARRALDKRSVKWYRCNTRSGLEVSWFKYFNENLSMISIGPEVHNMHDRNETLYVETTLNCLGVVLECIEQMRLHKRSK